MSPLHAAMLGGHRECVKVLQGHEALLGDEEQAWIESQTERRVAAEAQVRSYQDQVQAHEDRVRELEARLVALGQAPG